MFISAMKFSFRRNRWGNKIWNFLGIFKSFDAWRLWSDKRRHDEVLEGYGNAGEQNEIRIQFSHLIFDILMNNANLEKALYRLRSEKLIETILHRNLLSLACEKMYLNSNRSPSPAEWVSTLSTAEQNHYWWRDSFASASLTASLRNTPVATSVKLY